MSRFEQASEIAQNHALMVAIWGLPKTGKTSFVLGNEAAEYGLIDRVIEQRELELRRTGFGAQQNGN